MECDFTGADRRYVGSFEPVPAMYERVTFKPEGAKRARTVILQITGESAWSLSGIEVDREGDEVAPKGYDERLHVIDKTLISKRVALRMDLTYGELVDAE